MDITTITPYISLIYGIFLLGYWTAVGILIYHLKRFGLGAHTRNILYLILIGSGALTLITTLVYVQI